MAGIREYTPIEEATTPRDGTVLTNRWWVVHPEHGLTFWKLSAKDTYRAPQCNSDRAISEHVCNQIHPGHEVRFVEAVYLGHERSY